MSAIKKPSVLLTLFTLLIFTVGLTLALTHAVRAQESGTLAWSDMDIGAVATPGITQAKGNAGYSISDTGSIYGTNDAFNYLYEPMGTNGQIVVQVAAMQGAGSWAKAGVMIRETLDEGSRNAMMLVTLGQGSFFQWRRATDGNTDQTAGSTNTTAPCWVKIVRSGDWVGGYSSTDGINWTLAGWEEFNGLAPQVYVGLAVAGNNQIATATFDQINFSAAGPAAILNPVVGNGDGLTGSYYSNRHLYGVPVTNWVDRQIDSVAPANPGVTPGEPFADECLAALGMPWANKFSVCWAGELEAQFSESYTISMESDAGARVWINEQLVIDDWNCHLDQETQATINLVAGQRYLLRVEYYQNHGTARAKLSWSSPSTPKRVIPQNQLYSQPEMDPSGSGLPVLWEEHYFGRTGVDPNADPDGDGLSNLQEYRQHTDPTNPQTRGVPDTFGDGDVGGDYTVGCAQSSNGVFSVSCAGSDIWGNADSFHYVYQTMGTNVQIVARILGLAGTNQFAKAAVMLRESLEGKARNAAMVVNLSNTMSFQWRELAGSVSHAPSSLQVTLPCWVKVVRNGDWLGGYTSTDGTNWTLLDWVTFKSLAPQIYVGLAASAHNARTGTVAGPSTARFDQVNFGSAANVETMSVPEGNGDGLEGNYRNDSLLYLPGIINRKDPEESFYWGHAPPLTILNPDGYGVCWSGELQAQFTGLHTLSLETLQEDWVRVWINEKLVINGWRTWHPDGELKGTINLVAGQHYLIRVEMYNNLGHGKSELRWSCPSMSERTIPQCQLYSQPTMDPDGSGLPVIWEMIYFGHTGVDPNADPDHDGLSNLQEWEYHTNPTNSDTDGDGMADAWEIAHGLDPQYPNDAGMDYDNSGLSNLQDYLLGLNPFNLDVNDDGLPDWFEEEYLNTGPSLVCSNQISVAVTVNGSQATNYLGNWQVDGTDIYCLDRRGGLDFDLSVSNPDKYVLNLIGTQNQLNPTETSFKLLLGIDNQTLGHYILNAGYGTNGAVELVLPYLQAGPHTLHVFWDGVASFSSLRIKQVKLLAVSGSTNQNGIKIWAAQMMEDQSGLDNTNALVSSYTSPVCLEGRDPFPMTMAMTNSETNALSPLGTTDNRWYVNVPLSENTQTVFQASYQNGALTQTANLQWLAVNLLSATNLIVRQGDSLLFNALPANGAEGQLQVAIGTNSYSGMTTRPASYQFATPGDYTVTGTYTPRSGGSQSGSVTVDVVPRQQLPPSQPDAWTGMERTLNLTNFAPEAALQTDSRLTCFVSGTNANGGIQLTLGADANEPRSMLARLGTNGPVLDSRQVQGFDVWSGDQVYTSIIQVYPDGSQLVQMLVISSPLETNVTFVIQPIVSGVMFDDGTTLKVLTSTNFDALGQCPVRFIRPASAISSVCNSIKAYQGNYQIGYRN